MAVALREGAAMAEVDLEAATTAGEEEAVESMDAVMVEKMVASKEVAMARDWMAWEVVEVLARDLAQAM